MIGSAFVKAKKILKIIEQHGHKAYFVGGSVRDQLLGRDIGDIDITTSASPSDIQSIFNKVIPVGIDHGTVVVRYRGESYEVTTFRVEGNYSDFRHPDHVRFVDRIEDDLSRRDFTINAIAMDYDGTIIDPYNGKSDISNKYIRTVGKAEQRFQEDPLRMMRALRFSSQLGFHIELNTRQAIKKNMGWIEKIAIERITNEVEKLFAGAFVKDALVLFLDAETGKYLPIFKENPSLLNYLSNHEIPLFSLGEIIALFHFYEPAISVDTWVKEWKLSNQVKSEAKQLIDGVQYFKENDIDAWLVYNLQESLQAGFLRLVRSIFQNQSMNEDLKERRNDLPIKSRSDLMINGQDIVYIHPNRKKGPWINHCLSQLEKYVVFGTVPNNKHALREWVKRWSPPENS